MINIISSIVIHVFYDVDQCNDDCDHDLHDKEDNENSEMITSAWMITVVALIVVIIMMIIWYWSRSPE